MMNNEESFRPLTGIMIFNVYEDLLITNKDKFDGFRPLTGIMIFNMAGIKMRKNIRFAFVSVPLRGL